MGNNMIKNKLCLYTVSLLIVSSCSINEEQTSQPSQQQDNQDNIVVGDMDASMNDSDNVSIPEVFVDIKSAEPRRVPSNEPEVLDHRSTSSDIKKQPTLTHKQRFAGVLEAHNQARLKHGLTPLKWSTKLATYSQEWADYLGRGNHCQIKHRSGTPPYGENLYRSSALQWSDGRTELMAINIKEVVKSWTDEEKWYDYQRNRCQPGRQCGHYTQVVWKDTTEVGCAVKVCADKSQTWVCSYNPAGNYTGIRPY